MRLPLLIVSSSKCLYWLINSLSLHVDISGINLEGLDHRYSWGNYLRPSLINSFKKFLRSGYQGVNFFFSDSHLASKFFKVVANSKNVGRHSRDKKTLFLRYESSR